MSPTRGLVQRIKNRLPTEMASKGITVRKVNDLVLGSFSNVPPSKSLDHTVRFLSTWSGSDKFFMLVQYSIKLLIPVLQLRARWEYKAGLRKSSLSTSAASWNKLTSIISDSRALWRIWGILPIFQWLISLEHTAPPTRKLLTIERLQAWSMLVYYPLDHLSYLSSNGIVSLSKSARKQCSLWSCRAWAAYVVLQFLHLKEDYALLQKRQRTLQKDLAGTGEHKYSPSEAKELKTELRTRQAAMMNELVVNVANLPMALHWSLENGLFKKEIWVNFFGLIASVASFRGAWQAVIPPY